MLLATVPSLLLLLAAQSAPLGAPPAAPASSASRITVAHEHYLLDNGLHVILAPDHALPKVEINLWYRVGSKDEPLGRSGFAPLFSTCFMGRARAERGVDQIMEAGAATTARPAGPTNYFDRGPSRCSRRCCGSRPTGSSRSTRR